MLIAIIVGGIYSGIFTATEAAAMGAVYAFFISVFAYRDLSLGDVPKVLLNSANLSAMRLYIITNAVLLLEHVEPGLAVDDADQSLGIALDVVGLRPGLSRGYAPLAALMILPIIPAMLQRTATTKLVR